MTILSHVYIATRSVSSAHQAAHARDKKIKELSIRYRRRKETPDYPLSRKKNISWYLTTARGGVHLTTLTYRGILPCSHAPGRMSVRRNPLVLMGGLEEPTFVALDLLIS